MTESSVKKAVSFSPPSEKETASGFSPSVTSQKNPAGRVRLPIRTAYSAQGSCSGDKGGERERRTPQTELDSGRYRSKHSPLSGRCRSAQPSGAATPRNSDAHERVAVPQALCALREHTRPRPKSGKAVLTPGHAWFLNRAKRSDGSDTTPARNAPVSPCEPLCAILLAKARVYPLSPVKTNVNRLCECDLKPLWKGLSPCRMGRTFSVFQADQAVSGGKQDSRRSLLKRTLRRLCRRC